jgi:hypothetical protein
VRSAALKACPGAPHGLPSRMKEQFNAGLLALARA